MKLSRVIMLWFWCCLVLPVCPGDAQGDQMRRSFASFGHGPAPKGLTDVELTIDLFVAGGGPAGISTAVTAARSGVTVLLVDGRPVLGGNSGSEVRMHMMGADKAGARGKLLSTEAREGGIVEEYVLENCVQNPQRSFFVFDLTLYDLLRREANASVLLNTMLVSVEKDDQNKITRVICEDQYSQKRYHVQAKIYVDATGDGRLGSEAAIPLIMGRESKEVYNESLAPSLKTASDTETMGSSLMLTATDLGFPAPFTKPSWARTFTKADFKYRPITEFQAGFWWIEVSWPYNTISDNEQIRDACLEDLLGVWDYVKNSGEFPESAPWALDWVEWWPGKREGRRMQGMYVMSQDDVMKTPGESQAPTLFWDRVAYGGWNFDIHNPKAMNATDEPPYTTTPIPYMYSIPLRSFLTADVENIMFVGRLGSFSHVMLGSTRVMKTVSVCGQAVGTAAAYAITHGVTPASLATNTDAVWSIQQSLLRYDAFLIGVYNEDPRDVARGAFVNASSALENGAPENVLTGQTRAVDGPEGVAPHQAKTGTNRWISDGLPATLQLTFATPVNVSEIQLIFDTGQHRTLCLSTHDELQDRMQWGQPQEETIRDYTIVVRRASEWTTVHTVSGNYQRRRVHHSDAPLEKVEALRVRVTATNGGTNAHVLEVRVYGPDGRDPFPSPH